MGSKPMTGNIGYLNQLVVLSKYDFSIDCTVILRNGILDDCNGLLLNAYSDFCWRLSLSQEYEILFSLGDGFDWRFAHNLRTKIFLQIDNKHVIRFFRENGILTIKVDDQNVFNFSIGSDHNLLGSRIAIGCDRNLVSKLLRSRADLERLQLPIQYSFDMCLVKKFPLINTEGFHERVSIFSIIFGDLYSKFFNDYMVPSLLRQFNIPALQRYDTTIRIYCTNSEIITIQKSLDLLESIGCQIELNLITADMDQTSQKLQSQKVKTDPNKMAWCLNDAFVKSILNNEIIVFAMPDLIFGSGLSRVIDDMKPGDYVVCPHPRVLMKPEISIFREIMSTELPDIDPLNYGMVDAAFNQASHNVVKYGLKHTNDYWRAVNLNDRYRVFAKEPPPLCAHITPDFISVLFGNTIFGRFQSVDHDLVNYAFVNERLELIDDSRHFFWAEITGEDEYDLVANPRMFENGYFPLSARYLMSSPSTFYLETA